MVSSDAQTSSVSIVTLSDAAREAYKVLSYAGAHYVLATEAKRPIWPAWQRRRPLLEQVLSHDGPVGLIPWSIRSTALDVDQGDPAALIEEFPPRVNLPSLQSGRRHLYYNDTEPRHNARFSHRGVSGDLRSAHGYLILWRESVVDFLAQWVRGPVSPFPRDLFDWAGVTVDSGPIGPPLANPGPSNEDAPLDLSAVPIGRRNSALFDALRFWAYAQYRGKDAAAWDVRVLARARAANALLATPLPAREVQLTAYSVSTWTYAGHGPVDHRAPLQALRGVRSGKARRKARADRDSQLLDDVMSGITYAQIARELGISSKQVSRIVRRDAPMLDDGRRRRRRRTVRHVLEALDAGASQYDVASRFGLSRQRVGAILNRWAGNKVT